MELQISSVLCTETTNINTIVTMLCKLSIKTIGPFEFLCRYLCLFSILFPSFLSLASFRVISGVERMRERERRKERETQKAERSPLQQQIHNPQEGPRSLFSPIKGFPTPLSNSVILVKIFLIIYSGFGKKKNS